MPVYIFRHQHDRCGGLLSCEHRSAGALSPRALPPTPRYSSLPAPTRAAGDASRLPGRPLLLAAHPAVTLSAPPGTRTADLSDYEADGCGAVTCGAGQKRFVFVTEAPV